VQLLGERAVGALGRLELRVWAQPQRVLVRRAGCVAEAARTELKAAV
jgi:hypothetical protein